MFPVVLISCRNNGTGSTNTETFNGLSANSSQPDTWVLSDAVQPGGEKKTVISQILDPGPWVDSVMAILSHEEKIEQLFVVAIYPYNKSNDTTISQLLREHAIGGIIIMKGGPVSTAKRINKYQNLSKIPLLVCTDAEWGVKMRLDSVPRFPYQLALGAMEGDELVYEMGTLIARQHQRLGIHVNFAPVVDINNNPRNPVIGMRSFGENKRNVMRKGWAYAAGLQNNRILAIGKHFPGHGDTDVDSHLDLPVIRHSLSRLNEVEFYPFREMINKGLGGIMTTHLYVPAIDATPHLAAGLSQPAVTGILKGELGFKGLIFTDALNMKGVTKYFPNGEIDVKALLAGNDVMLMPENIKTSLAAVKKAIADGIITMKMVEEKVQKILSVKRWVGLNRYQPTSIPDLLKDLNNGESNSLNQRIANASVTLLFNKNHALPLPEEVSDPVSGGSKVAVISIGSDPFGDFQNELKHLGLRFEHHSISSQSSETTAKQILADVKGYDHVLVAVHANGFRPKNNYGIGANMSKAIALFSRHPHASLIAFTDAFALGKMQGIENYQSVVALYQNTPFTQKAGAHAVLGKFRMTGKFPVTLNDKITAGMCASE